MLVAQDIAPPSAAQSLAPPDKPADPFASIGAGAAESRKRVDALDAESMKLTPPKLELPPKPKPQSTDPIDAWGSIAMVFAGLASTRVRNHATAAMNAAASAMKGIQQKDKDSYDQAFKEWEVETKNALDMAHFQQDAYKTLLDSVAHREDIALREGQMADAATEAKLRSLTTSLGDPGMWQAYQHGGLKGAMDFDAQRVKDTRAFELKKMELGKAGQDQARMLLAQQIMGSDAFKNAKTEQERLRLLAVVDPEKLEPQIAKLEQKDKEDQERSEKDHSNAQFQAKEQYDTWKASPEGQAANPEQSAAKEAEFYKMFQTRGGRVYPPLSSENKKFTAEQLASYQEKFPSLSSIAYRNDPDGWTDVLKQAKQINPGFNEAKYDTVKKARDKITSGKDGDAIASYVRLNQHLELFEHLISQLPNNADITAFDKLGAWFGRQTGNSDVTSYDTALQLVGDEIVKAATGTGAAGALGDREEIKKNFSPGASRAQLMQNVDTVRGLVGGAIVSTLNKYRSVLDKSELSEITGLSPEDLRRYHVDPTVLQPTVKGPVTLGGKTVNITDEGAGPAAAPQNQTDSGSYTVDKFKAAGGQIRQTKDGRQALGRNGKWIVIQPDGTFTPVSETDLQ